MSKQLKKMLSLILAVAVTITLFMPQTEVYAKAKAAKVTISKKKLSLEVGQSANLKVKQGKKDVTKKAKWSTGNKKVATVKKGKIKAVAAGKAVITAKVGKKKVKCQVTVTAKGGGSGSGGSGSGGSGSGGSGSGGSGSGGSGSGGSGSGGSGTQTPTLVDNGFDYAKDVQVIDTAPMTHVSFIINEANVTAEELAAQGYTIGEKTVNGSKKKTADKDIYTETRTYRFTKIPNTLRGLQTIPLTGEYNPTTPGYVKHTPADTSDPQDDVTNGIGFNTMFATIMVAANFRGYTNPGDPHGDKDPLIQEMRKMFEYLNGPRTSDDIANAKWQSAVDSMKDATRVNNQGNPNVYLCYLGAQASNNYADPGTYEVNVYRGPYFIKEKQTITGKRPTTYMIFNGKNIHYDGDGAVSVNNWGTDRYIDVWKSSDKNWYSWQNSFHNVLANNFAKGEEGF